MYRQQTDMCIRGIPAFENGTNHMTVINNKNRSACSGPVLVHRGPLFFIHAAALSGQVMRL